MYPKTESTSWVSLRDEEKFAGMLGVGVTTEKYVNTSAASRPKPAKIGSTRR